MSVVGWVSGLDRLCKPRTLTPALFVVLFSLNCSTQSPITEVVWRAKDVVGSKLPLPERAEGESDAVGSASQSFNETSRDKNSPYVGYVAGTLTLPSAGIKDAESTGSCTHIFTVCKGQPNALEVAFGSPHTDGLDDKTAQRFLLSEGDQFRIPPGNTYRIENHSKATEARIAWTIIRPRAMED